MEEILKHCSHLPYHNRAHTLAVVEAWKILGLLATPEQVAMYWHDILHTGTARDGDEERAADATISEGVTHGIITSSQGHEVNNLILGTIFKNRGNLTWKQPLIADADIAAIGQSFPIYLKNAARLFVEQCFSQNKIHPSREEILSYWTQGQEWFFTYLTNITGKADVPFLTKDAQSAFPHFVKNRQAIGRIARWDPDFVIDAIRKEWKEFYWKDLILFEEQK